jgi:hypothetical protein
VLAADTTGHIAESAFTGPGKVISRPAAARISAVRGSGGLGAEAIMGAAGLASGEVAAGTP